MTQETSLSSLISDETSNPLYVRFISQLLEWNIQFQQSHEYSTAFTYELGRISNDLVRFRLRKPNNNEELGDEELGWHQLKVSFGMRTYGILLVHPALFDSITEKHWFTISFLCAQCLQTHAIQDVLELRLGIAVQVAQEHVQQLTPQERKVLQAMLLGQTTKVIARSLGIKDRSVETYKYSLYQKLAIATETDAVLEALLAGTPVF